MVTQCDLEIFSRACLRLYDPALDTGSYAQHAVAFLREIVSSDMVCVAAMDKKVGTLGVHFSDWDPTLPALLAGFGRTMGKYDLFNWDPKVNDGKPFFRGDFFSERQFRDLDVYCESFGLMKWGNHCAVHVPSSDGNVVFIGLERSGTVDYTERDRTMLELAQTHLSNARKLAAARVAVRGERPLDPRDFERAGFSPRTAEVLMWLTEGKSNAEIAKLMGVTLQTVKFHLTTIFNKVGVSNRLAATLYALELARRLKSANDETLLHVRI